MEVHSNNNELDCNIENVLSHWQTEFSTIYNAPVVDKDLDVQRHIADYITLAEQRMSDPLFVGNAELNRNISEAEILTVINRLKCKKAVGNDEIPNEVLKCKGIVPLLQQ